jgi:hypothetical protein
VSTQLSALVRADLVTGRRDGRRRIYAPDAARIEPVLTGLQFAATLDDSRPDLAARRHVARNTPLRQARRCYDHIAGRAAVALLDVLLERGWLTRQPGTTRRADYALAPEGERALQARGVNIAAARLERRLLAFGCPDWTEPRPHLGGALGRALTDALERDDIISRHLQRREVHLESPLTSWLDPPAP